MRGDPDAGLQYPFQQTLVIERRLQHAAGMEQPAAVVMVGPDLAVLRLPRHHLAFDSKVLAL